MVENKEKFINAILLITGSIFLVIGLWEIAGGIDISSPKELTDTLFWFMQGISILFLRHIRRL